MQNIQVLKLSRTKEIIFSAVFTAMAVYAPMVVHYFGGVDAGRKFLPMPFFVLLAGLMLGWRAGLATGLFSPIISYLISGMPMLPILPIIIIQLSFLGLISGIMKSKYNVWLSLTVAIIASWFAMGIAVYFFSSMSMIKFLISAAKDGWVGTAAQLAVLPFLASALRRFLAYGENL
ncbi:MAG: hypothetical protein COZ28_01805 [Candidatus Moranbacteria bacterium CG_4_10_14_3_um_filter_44_15]|nr:MAG: hypothetical protein COS72_01835 [Candidatus Moranbacteria bacterium CG06_land_8_20_14_3_00_43_56]PIV83387.1 MAG: hypothetical protein COW51_04620 [Candidatus Moranbacteria bacterium CG17_big_fil_post_rev_8_21_14_2_50_44_12]PIW92915.1 MAG: hypothetical protein COZ87_04055 [Candidatus Moranbacteria bacterium CG_4_8_14_3_um_filter_43_15]PIX90854.1 MAG: hypothetical protein COZ28_01805 [Candidatus Moranbacteria bacterium CG_4_10_14_3_um_filter_44_15]PJA85798.1 MAG: hypothetical protein CO1